MRKTIITVKLLEDDCIRSLKTVVLPDSNSDGFCGKIELKLAKGVLVDVERGIEKLKIIKDNFETKIINMD